MLFLYELHVYVSMLFTLFHHISMFMFQRFLHYFTMCMFMFPCFLHLFTIFLCLCFDAFYTISPYFLICYVSMLFTPFHHISMFMFQRFLHYFIILLYVYVSIFSYYFTVHISSCALCFHTTHTISPHTLLYVHIYMFSHMNSNSLKIVSLTL